jgi:tape measure domain-containing protein
MSTTIGKVAYVATWDASQLVKGVMTSRQQFSAQRKIVESMKSPLDRYSTGMENLKAIIEKYPDVARHQLKVEKDLTRQYLSEESAVRKLTATEAKRLKALTMSADGGTVGKAGASTGDINRTRGLAEQSRIQRYTAAVDKEAAIGRRALQDRLRLFKAEKSAEEKKTRDLQSQFNKRMRLEESASRARARLLNRSTLQSPKSSKAASALGMAGMGGIASKALPAVGAISAGYYAKGFLRDSIAMHASVERSAAAFEVFTGSAGKAARMMSQLRTLSSQSATSFDSLQNAASTMMSFGVAADRTLPALRQMAEITRGDAERLGSLSLAFAQSAAAGKLMGQDLLQMVNAGFSPLQEISRTTGKSISDLRKKMESGAISFQMVANAFKTATAEGGKFNGMLEKIGDTTAGSLGRVSAEYSIFKDKVGEKASPATKLISSGLAETLAGGSLLLSKYDDQIQRRIDDAKTKNNKKSMSWQGGLTGLLFQANFRALTDNSSMTGASKLNNDIDEQLAKFKEKNAKLEKAKEKAQDFMAPKPTAAGSAEIYRLNVELGLIDKIFDRRKQLASMGLNQIEVQRVLQMEKQLELIEKQKAAQEKFQNDRRDQMEQMRERGRELMKDLQSPMQAYRAELADLILLRRNGVIDDKTLMAGAGAAAGRLPSQDSKPASLAPTMRANSEEAYRYFAEMQARRNRPAKDDPAVMQVKIMNDLASLNREGNRILAGIRDGLPTIGSDG